MFVGPLMLANGKQIRMDQIIFCVYRRIVENNLHRDAGSRFVP